METLFSAKIFVIEASHNLHVLKFPEFKKWFLKIGICVCMCGEYSALYISKANKDRDTKFYTRYQTFTRHRKYFLVLKKLEKPEVG